MAELRINIGEPKDYIRDLVKRLDEYHITNRQLADEMGVDTTAVSRWLNNPDSNPTLKTVIAIEKAIITLRRRMRTQRKGG